MFSRRKLSNIKDTSNKVTIATSLVKRLLAFSIDMFFLIILSTLILRITGDFFSWGGIERLICIIISVLYFSILSTSVGRGQTIGKRFLKIKIVKLDGGYLTYLESFISASIIIIPFFMINWRVLSFSDNHIVTGLFSLTGSLLILLNALLIITDRVHRSSLADRSVLSIVVNKSFLDTVELSGISILRKTVVFLIVISVVLLKIYYYFDNSITLKLIESEILSIGNMYSVSIQINYDFVGDQLVEKYQIDCRVKNIDNYYDKMPELIADLFMTNSRIPILQGQEIIVNTFYGADFGLANNFEVYSEVFIK